MLVCLDRKMFGHAVIGHYEPIPNREAPRWGDQPGAFIPKAVDVVDVACLREKCEGLGFYKIYRFLGPYVNRQDHGSIIKAVVCQIVSPLDQQDRTVRWC